MWLDSLHYPFELPNMLSHLCFKILSDSRFEDLPRLAIILHIRSIHLEWKILFNP
jgi:hypothetical protein